EDRGPSKARVSIPPRRVSPGGRRTSSASSCGRKERGRRGLQQAERRRTLAQEQCFGVHFMEHLRWEKIQVRSPEAKPCGLSVPREISPRSDSWRRASVPRRPLTMNTSQTANRHKLFLDFLPISFAIRSGGFSGPARLPRGGTAFPEGCAQDAP